MILINFYQILISYEFVTHGVKLGLKFPGH